MTFKKIFVLLGLVLTLAFTFTAAPVNAANFSLSTSAIETGSRSVTTDEVTKTIANIANIVIGIIAAISVFYIIYGAVVWMNKGAGEGQTIVVNAVVGLIIAILAFFIVQFAVGAGGFLNNTLSNTK